MPTRLLPSCPSLEFLTKEAKRKLKQIKPSKPNLSLAHAQHELAREYGFVSWAKLKQHVTKPDQDSSPLGMAMRALRGGLPIILYDDSGRESEGDYVYAAEKITSQSINFLTKNGRGTLCLALPPEHVDRLKLPLVRQERESIAFPAFTASIDAREGISTGVSAADRAQTILAAVSDCATPDSVRSPGHVFPLRAVAGGLRSRRGHTEASIDMVRRSGLKPAAVICEILNDDGTMARLLDVKKLSAEKSIPLICFSDLES